MVEIALNGAVLAMLVTMWFGLIGLPKMLVSLILIPSNSPPHRSTGHFITARAPNRNGGPAPLFTDNTPHQHRGTGLLLALDALPEDWIALTAPSPRLIIRHAVLHPALTLHLNFNRPLLHLALGIPPLWRIVHLLHLPIILPLHGAK